MNITPQQFVFFAVLGFSLAAPLGPVNMEMIKVSTSRRRGWIFGVLTGLGASFADFIIATIVLFIGAEVLYYAINIRWLMVTLLLANAALLSYIGVGALRAKPEFEEVGDNLKEVGVRQFSLGFAIVVSSPWSYLWWASFGPTIVASEVPLNTFEERFIVTLMFIVGIWGWVILLNVGMLISSKMASKKVMRGITVGSALLIFLFSISIVLDAIWIMIYGEPLKLIERLL